MNRIKRRLLLLKQYKRRLRLWMFAPIFVFGLFLLFGSQPVEATAKKSTLTISVDNPGMAFTVIGSSGGNFGKSGINTVTATTDNFTGYQLKIASVESRSFVNGDDDEIVPIDNEINETTFQNSALYNNKWGYVPSQFITTINEENTVIQNTNYLPAPSLEGDLLAITNAANTTADTYTLSFGARVDATLPTGSYEYTYVLQMVGNDVVYNVTFDKNTTETVTDMPVPNPQPLVMPGGTPTEQSYVALSDAVPIMTSGDELTFGGWCDEMTTLDATTGNYECPGTTYAAGADYPIDQTADGTNITLYAIWISEVDPFPTVWSHMGACIFNGKTGGNITGSECTEYHDKQYIDTEVALYNDANYEKDYQVHFKIDSYDPSQQSSEQQQTFFNDKLSSKAGNKQSPGIVVRRESSSSKIEINSRLNNSPASYSTNASNISTVDVYRINHMIYYSINSGPLVMLQDLTGSSEKFGINAWFGAYPYDEDCTVDCTKAKRFIDATMSEMYIKLGDFDESGLYEITFNGNGGTSSTDKYLIMDGNALGDLPTATRSDWYFLGWFTDQSGGTQITKNTVPTATTTYWAHWVKTVAQAIITNPDITVPKDGTETINVSNANEVEPYTFSSTDPTIATVNSTTGEVTGVAVGSTTIIMTGTLSHDTRTVNVTVSGSAVTLTFDADGGAAVEPVSVGQGATLGYIPASIKQGYILDGWYTGAGGTGQKLLTTTPINDDTLYYANWVAGSFVCEKAKSLHTETCTRSSNGCNLAGYGTGDTITYGQLIQTSTMNYGDAYNCDINGDNEFDETNERFYYIGVNPDNDNASLVYYKSMINSDRNYSTAITDLPTSSTWTNDKLTVFDGTRVGRFMKRSEVQRVCGSIQELPTNIGVDGNCVYLMEQSSFYDTSLREGIWLEAEGDPSDSVNRYRIQTASLKVTNKTSGNTPRPVIELPIGYLERGGFTPTPATTYDLTFVPHNETSSSVVTIDAGDPIGADMPNDPTYLNHLFQGWFTEETGGTLVTSQTTPTGDATYHAQWKGTVVLANITNTNINIVKDATETINVTNANEIEGYSFTSNNTSVATVDSSGVVTGIGQGTTTITMEGAVSHATRTINVTVTTPVINTYDLTFEPHNGGTATIITIDAGDPIGTLPADPLYTDHLFQGWYTEASGGNKLNGTERPIGDTTYHAQWKLPVTEAIFNPVVNVVPEDGTEHLTVSNASELEEYRFSSSDTSILVVDEITGELFGVSAGDATITMTGQQSHLTKTLEITVATGITSTNVCILADSLHQGTIKGTSTVVDYGQIATSPTPQVGDAYDCDINNDSIYNASNERFYYIGRTGENANDNAVLVAFSSFDDTEGDEYGWHIPTATSTGSYAYSTALDKLPSTTRWSNPDLVHHTIAQDDTRAARFLTYDEATTICSGTTGLDSNCKYLLENTAYDDKGRTGIWLMQNGSTYYRIHSTNKNIVSVQSSSGNGARPVIEVPYDLIEKFEIPSISYTVTFNSMGGSDIGSVTVPSGTALGNNYPATDPIKADYEFFGWYTDSGFTDEVTPETVINGDVTFYAKWVYNGTNFPIVWMEKNACVFNGTNPIAGDYCTKKDANDPKSYIDTGIALYSSTNYDTDYEIGFKILSFAPTGNQETLMNEKLEYDVENYPGIMMRRATTTSSIELIQKINNVASPTASATIGALTDVRIVRDGGVVKYSFNGNELTTLQDLNQVTKQTFDTTTWFGASAKYDSSTGLYTPQRQIHGVLTDMYIKMGTYEESSERTVKFDANGGETSEEYRYLENGDQLGALPTATRSGSFTFDGWYTEKTGGTLADPTDTITSNRTYWAHWQYHSSTEIIPFNVENPAVRGYQEQISQWLPDITTFNEDATDINKSTWGIPEADFWLALKNNYEANDCYSPAYAASESAIDFASGHVDCSKPSVYETGVTEALDVYEYDTVNHTHGSTPVAWAKADEGVIHNMIPGKTYYWQQQDDPDIYGYVAATADNGRRFIDSGEVRNVRDLGGLPVDTNGDGTIDGSLKYEKLFRGERLWKHGNTTNVQEIANLGVTKEIDLRNSGEGTDDDRLSDLTGDLSDYELKTIVHYESSYGSSYYAAARSAVTQTMDDVIAGENIFFHCRVGADRTGTLAYILEGLLGVPNEYRYQEYELTSLSGMNDRTRYYKQKSSSLNHKFVYMMGFLLTTQNVYDWYMAGSSDTEQSHPDADRIANFRAAMINSNN